MAHSDDIPQFTIGDRLRKARQHAGVSTAEMAAVLECHERTVLNYETEATHIRRPSLVAWAMRCGVDVVWLATGHEHTGERQKGPPLRSIGR